MDEHECLKRQIAAVWMTLGSVFVVVLIIFCMLFTSQAAPFEISFRQPDKDFAEYIPAAATDIHIEKNWGTFKLEIDGKEHMFLMHATSPHFVDVIQLDINKEGLEDE